MGSVFLVVALSHGSLIVVPLPPGNFLVKNSGPLPRTQGFELEVDDTFWPESLKCMISLWWICGPAATSMLSGTTSRTWRQP